MTAFCGGGAVVGLVLTLSWPDTPGRLLFALATVVLVLYVVTDILFSPRLLVDAEGVSVHSPFTRGRWTWPEVARIQADARQRYGVRSVTLEIDVGDQLVVLSRRALGEAPDVVAEVAASFAPRR